MIDYIDTACKAWGRCTRWILADTGEGYPGADTIAKAHMGLLDAASRRSMARHFGEVRLGDALEIATALRQEPHMPLHLHATLWAHYVAVSEENAPKLKAAQRATVIARYLHEPVSVAQYWRNIDRAHHFLAGRLVPREKSLQQNSA